MRWRTRGLPRTRGDPRQSHRRLGNSIRHGDYGWKNLLDQRALQQNPLAEIVRIYKETNALAASDPQVREACREELVKLQGGDKENIDIWNECVAFSMRDFEDIYKLLDIHYDIQCGESFYNDRLPGVVERLLKSGIAEISEGAVVVFFSRYPGVGRHAMYHPQTRRRI